MRRTQIYLDQGIIKLLAKLASQTGKTRSELIREAIKEVYDQEDVNLTLEKLESLNSFKDSKQINNLRNKDRQWS